MRYIKLISNDLLKELNWFASKLETITSSIRAFIRKVKRSFDYAVHGWNSYDWDYGYLFDLIEFKLKRMQREIEKGHHLPDKKTDQSLRLCLKLLKRINKRDYRYFCDLHEKKWGELEWIWHETYEDGTKIPNNCTRLELKRPNAQTQEEKNKEIEEFRIAYKKDEMQRERDVRWLFNIMGKYHQAWWD